MPLGEAGIEWPESGICLCWWY